MGIIKSTMKFIAAPVLMPLRAFRNVKGVVTAIKTDVQNLDAIDSANEKQQERSANWRELASQAAVRSRRYWISSSCIWLFFSYKVLNPTAFILLFNLFCFALILAIFATKEALTCAQLRENRKVLIKSLFTDGKWFPVK